jgi:hypothetical protein
MQNIDAKAMCYLTYCMVHSRKLVLTLKPVNTTSKSIYFKISKLGEGYNGF